MLLLTCSVYFLMPSGPSYSWCFQNVLCYSVPQILSVAGGTEPGDFLDSLVLLPSFQEISQAQTLSWVLKNHRRFFKLCTSLRKWNGGKLACMLSELVCIYGLGFTTWYIDLVKFFRGALILSLIGDKPQDFVYFSQVQCHDPQVALEYEPRNLIFTTVFLFKNHTYITSKYCAEYWLIKTLDLDYVLHVDNVVCLLSPFQYLACSTLNKSQ